MPEEYEGRGSDWSEYSRLVLSELQRNSRQFDAVNDKIERIRSDDISQLKADIMLLKFQAAFWGSVGGVIFSTLIPLALKFIK